MEKTVTFTELEIAELLRVIYDRVKALSESDGGAFQAFQDCMEMTTLGEIIAKLDPQE